MALHEVFWIFGAITLLILVLTLGGMQWLWRAAPTRESAEAVASVIKGYWVSSSTLLAAAFAGWWFSSDSRLWVLPFPFLMPAAIGTLYYRRTFLKTGVPIEIFRQRRKVLGD
jgi:hypothetical protein